MNMNYLPLLQAIPIFGGLPVEALNCLLSDHQMASFAKDAWIVQQGEPPGPIYILEEGEVAVYKKVRGLTFQVNTLGRGECIGEMSLIDPTERSASIQAVTDCHALVLQPKDFYKLRQVDLSWFTLLQLNIARELCRRLRTVEERFFTMIAENGVSLTV